LEVSVRPAWGAPLSYFKLSARPGHTTDAGQIVLINRSSKHIRLTIFPVDSQTSDTLGSAYGLPGALHQTATHWIGLSRRTVRIAAHQQTAVSVSVKVPRHGKPGDYLSAISIEVPSSLRARAPSRRVSIVNTERYAIGVETTLPGRRRPLIQFTGASVKRDPAGLSFLLDAGNPGNVILQGVHGWARVTRGKRTVAHTPIGPGTFVRGTSIQFPLRALHETPSQGTTFHVSALMRYRGGVARLEQNVTFGHRQALVQQSYGGPRVPDTAPWWRWPLIALASLAVLGTLLLLLWRRRGPSSRAATLRLLKRTLTQAHLRGEPVSVTLLTAHSAKLDARALAHTVRPRLRRADRLGSLGHAGLLIVSRDMASGAAEALCQDLRDYLSSQPDSREAGVSIHTATSWHATDANDLIGQIDRQPTVGFA
jgi:hypothetical protein